MFLGLFVFTYPYTNTQYNLPPQYILHNNFARKGHAFAPLRAKTVRAILRRAVLAPWGPSPDRLSGGPASYLPAGAGQVPVKSVFVDLPPPRNSNPPLFRPPPLPLGGAGDYYYYFY